jgi:hypothetical protein
LVLRHAGLNLGEVDIHEDMAMVVDLDAATSKQRGKQPNREARKARKSRPENDRLAPNHREIAPR